RRHRSAHRCPPHGPETARSIARHAHHLGRRIWPHALRPIRLRPRPQQPRLHPLDGRRRRQRRLRPRRHRRIRLPGSRKARPHPRLARHHPPPPRPRPHPPHLLLRRPPL